MEKVNSGRKWFVWVGGLIIILALVWGGLSKNTELGSGAIIKFGVVLPLTGAAADYGQSVKKGIDLAVTKALGDYKIKLEPVYEDSQMDSKLALGAIQKLINTAGVKYVIGFSSGETLSMCPTAEANKVVLISSASSLLVTTKCGDYTFRNAPADTYQGQVLAKKIWEKGYKNISIFYINNDYGSGLKDEFIKNYKGSVVGVESHKPGDIDFRTQLTKIKAGQPEAVVLISQMPEGSIILKQKTELGLKQPVFASEAIKDPNLLKLGSEPLQNLFISFISQYDGEEFQSFKRDYEQVYGEEFGAYSDYEYDNVLTLARAIKNCQGGHDSDCVKKEIYKTNLVGATGLINFDANGDRVNKDYLLYQVKDGQFVKWEK